MISEDSVFVQLTQVEDYICIVELACLLDASVAEVRQGLKNLGDRVENNGHDQWRVVRKIITKNLLTEEERIERDELENTVQQAFVIAGDALKRLRDRKLYRETHKTFESYVKERFDFSRSAAYYLIDASEVVNNLKCQQIVDKNISTKVLPSKESHCRPLAKLSPVEQTRAWEKAVEKADGKIPSSRLIKEAVREIKSVDNVKPTQSKTEPSFKEVDYKAGLGLEYTVRLDEETYKRLQAYQDRIGSATKTGAIARLLDGVVSS